MINKIKGKIKSNKIIKIFSFLFQSVLLVILTFTVLTFITSRTSLLGSIQSMVVLSGSMEPELPVGSVVYIIKQLGYDRGSMITFQTENQQNVTHRITNIEYSDKGTFYSTKGDANKVIDTNKVESVKVLGKVFFTIPYLGKVTTFLNSPRGFLSLIIAPTFIFIIYELWNIKKEIERSVEKRVMARLQQQQSI